MIAKVSLKQVNNFLLCGILICLVLYFAQKVLIPITYSVFFAMLFTPLSNKMEKHGVGRIWTTLISLLILVTVILSIGFLVYMQSKKLAEEFPQIEKKSQGFILHVEDYLNHRLNIPPEKQKEMIEKQIRSAGASLQDGLKHGFISVASMLGSAVIALIFTFLFLYQRGKYESFFIQLCINTEPDEARKLIGKISSVAQNYLTGRALSILIFTVLFSSGFFIIGLKNAFLLAFIAALLTIVPYVGSIVGGLFPFAVALVTDSTSTAFWALMVVVIIQGIDNYFIEPYIIGGEVNISAFFTILILFVGGLLWGVAGMILFLPMLAVAKIIFDQVPGLQVYGFLIGDQEQEKQSVRLWNKIKKLFGK